MASSANTFLAGDVRNVIISNLELHKQVIAVDSKGYYCCQQALDNAQDLQSRAATRLIMQNYSNQLLGPLINVAVYATVKKFHHNGEQLFQLTILLNFLLILVVYRTLF